MELERVQSYLGRKLRYAMVGGSPESFIGIMHRMAAALDGYFELVCGVLSSKEDKARDWGERFGFAPDRQYGSYLEMLDAEAAREDGADLVVIATPNASHYSNAAEAMRRGFHVICDKPITNTLEEARELEKLAEETGVVFCLTHNYSAYPMVRQARELIESGAIGDILMAQVAYIQGGRAVLKTPARDEHRAWKYYSDTAGPSLVLGDIGTHAHHLLRFVTGLEVESLSARIERIIPGQMVDDFVSAELRLKGGIPASLMATQAAAGIQNDLHFRISGSKGTLVWKHESAHLLSLHSIDAPVTTYVSGGPGTTDLSAWSARIGKGSAEGSIAAFANLYREAGEDIAARIAGTQPDPRSLHYPKASDGVRGLEFVEAAISSASQNGLWVNLPQS